MARKVRPISELTTVQQRRRRLARRLGLNDEDALTRWEDRHRNYEPDDPRYLRPGLAETYKNYASVRRHDKTYKTPGQELLRKKQALVDERNKTHFSPFAFLEKYQAAIIAALNSSRETRTTKTKLRQLLRELQENVQAQPLQRRYNPPRKKSRK